jgi:hypothetical protein
VSPLKHPGGLGVLVLPWDFAVEFWDGAMSDKRRRPLCEGVRLDGHLCRVARRPGSRFCFSHDPATARKREPLLPLMPQAGHVDEVVATGLMGPSELARRYEDRRPD